MSAMEIGRIIAGAMEYRGELLPLSDDAYPPRVGASPWSVPGPMVLDTGAARSLGWRPEVSYREAAGGICAWLRDTAAGVDWRELFPVLAGYPYDHFDYAAEDAAMP